MALCSLRHAELTRLLVPGKGRLQMSGEFRARLLQTGTEFLLTFASAALMLLAGLAAYLSAGW